MYTERKFNIVGLEGLSERQIGEHLKLYAGYVKNTNALLDTIKTLEESPVVNATSISEYRRRMGFEFNGMRLHEYYFEALGNGGSNNTAPSLTEAIAAHCGSFDGWLSSFKTAGLMRGIGWVLLVRDPDNGRLITTWVADHEIGVLAGAQVLLAMDVWEHAYLLDYLPSQRKDYIEVFFKNLNWSFAEKRFLAHNK
ncbi:MAG: superoxide dismutase [Candidatus Vogelbacteria bacterium]|nr:superoxide dismutase [Candidatus Vogelbacteria bacterium]